MTAGPAKLAAQAAADLAQAAAVYVDAIEEAGRYAEELADAEARLRAAENAAGIQHRRPLPRELAAEAAIGHLRALRPYIGFVTRRSGELAAEALLRVDWTRTQATGDRGAAEESSTPAAPTAPKAGA